MYWATISALLLGLVSSAAVTYFVMLRADRMGLVQQVSQRSSHSRPTPTGGGLGIVAGTMAGGFLLVAGNNALTSALALSLVVALVGAVDDRWPQPAKLRLAMQLLIVGLLVVSVKLLSPPGLQSDPGWKTVFMAAAVLAGVWWINLFNFMDGIDGLAGTEALFIFLAAIALLLAVGTPFSNPLPGLLGVAGLATLGFLCFNWPPARIFMGDVGSTFLGFLIFACALQGDGAGDTRWPQWIILAALFIADATTTLTVRFLNGENVLEAHKNHAYQRLARRWESHRKVTMALVATNVVLVLPLAWLAGRFPEIAWILAGGTLAMFSAVAYLLGAGRAS